MRRRLRNLWAALRGIKPRTWAFILVGVVIVAIATGSGFWAWDYANSPVFCGTTCHTMPPHYESYQASSHARVKCVECHIGRTSFGVEITRKSADAKFVVSYLTGRYEYPLYVKDLQPARETCEKCHWPQKFSNDKIVNLTHFASDATNSPQTTTLVMKTGGGTQRQGQGFGIHWHIENKVEFIATDDQKQNIPWVRVTDASGKQTVYADIQKPTTADEVNKAEANKTLFTMDCIDCHNRTSHNFQSPEEAMDQALQNKLIDPAIPNIKQKGIDLLTPSYDTPSEAKVGSALVPPYKSLDEAKQAIANLEKYYQESQPEYYSKNTAAVTNAITVLQNLYPTLHYPDQGLDWTTHADNLGHKDWPGCFRCHDGKHFTADNQQAIRLECNVCHSIPEVTTPGGPSPAVQVAQAQEPASHKTTTWLAQHRTVFDASCQQCHDTRNAGGKDNTSFCSNSACHGANWKFAGLNAPELAKIVAAPVAPRPSGGQPPQIPHPIGGSPDCQICHGPNSKVRPFPADHAGRTNETCTACHQPSIAPTQGTEPKAPPTIPHDLAGRSECLGCHGNGMASVPQVPQFHKDYQFQNNACLTCHKTTGVAPAPAPATLPPEMTPTPTPLAPAAAPTTAAPTAAATAAATTAAPTSAPTATTAKPTATTAAPVSAAPNQPADHVGRTTCTACHANGVGPALPANHAGRTDAVCASCHKPPR